MNNMILLKEASEKWNISERRIRTICTEGRIDDAVKIGPLWAIPSDAEKPADKRITTGKYIKKQPN